MIDNICLYFFQLKTAGKKQTFCQKEDLVCSAWTVIQHILEVTTN